MIPTTQKAVVITEEGCVLHDTGVPKPGVEDILVKVAAAAQNPTDWKTADRGKKIGAIVGCDFVGTVVEIGSNVPAGVRSVGERVAGFVQGALYPNGSFSEYLTAPAQVVVHVPDSWSDEDAAQLGIAPFTAAQTLWSSQVNFPTPLAPSSTSPPTPLLVSAGSSSVGQYVIQFAKLSGFRVLAFASPKNFDLVRSLGADEVFNYKDPEASKKVRDATQGQLKFAVDTFCEKQTPKQVADALSDEGGVVSAILPYQSVRENIKVVNSIAYTLLGKNLNFPMKFTATELETARGRKYAQLLSDVLATGKIKPNPTRVFPKGLASVPEGLQYMRDGKVSGEKITYRIADTPK
ncbi:hypothetical protein EW146_g9700 [Bondarzewia mesenterica]|uniref:Enoyl reductase (ER) domain-containing protein n=1 Tax=Bondarzewia mesenterica TaxID=1095465 RepID=A0A4S4L5J4_9AGAM|nr:hypothetical protein EW146_g9700 [Bondarzewia mesenterica]